MSTPSRRPQQWFYFGPWAFSIDGATALITTRPRDTQPLNVAAWATAYGLDRIDDPNPHVINLIGPSPAGLDRQHAMITDLTMPVVVAQLSVAGEPTPLLIDGVHRLYRAWREGQAELPAHLLTVKETPTDPVRRDHLARWWRRAAATPTAPAPPALQRLSPHRPWPPRSGRPLAFPRPRMEPPDDLHQPVAAAV